MALAAVTNFCVALRSNGTVAAWGNNDHGQTSVPGNATNVVAIAAGDFHALALKENGTVVAWGLNTSSQCVVPAGLSNVMAVAAGWAHSVALKNDGTVVAWGGNTYEQTDVGGGLKGIKLLAAGDNISSALQGGHQHGERAARRISGHYGKTNVQRTDHQRGVAGRFRRLSTQITLAPANRPLEAALV